MIYFWFCGLCHVRAGKTTQVGRLRSKAQFGVYDFLVLYCEKAEEEEEQTAMRTLPTLPTLSMAIIINSQSNLAAVSDRNRLKRGHHRTGGSLTSTTALCCVVEKPMKRN